MRLQRAHDPDRAVRVIDGDVNVHAEDQLAARDVLQHVDERAIALAAGDALALEQAERVRAGAAEPKPLRRGRCDRVRAKAVQLALDVGDPAADGRVELHERLEQLRRHQLSEVAVCSAPRMLSMRWTRSSVSASSSMYSSSTPTVSGGPAPNR